MKLVNHFQLGEVDLLGVASHDGRFVAVGRDGVVFERDDRGVWGCIDVGFDEDLYGVL